MQEAKALSCPQTGGLKQNCFLLSPLDRLGLCWLVPLLISLGIFAGHCLDGFWGKHGQEGFLGLLVAQQEDWEAAPSWALGIAGLPSAHGLPVQPLQVVSRQGSQSC